ncbi:MAG: FAD-dependent oxidoreductase [Gammaproteobacteria bacterium]|nr:FAD-dependent oxidoreductase [Gammaproteobacteria bacterium]
MTIYTRGGYALPGSSLAFKTGSWRVQKPRHVHGAAPCHAVCPAGEDAQAWLARVDEGDVQNAWRTLVQANPLPAITGRVCPHPCESACNRGEMDAPVAIHAVERYLGDEAIRHAWDFGVPTPKADAPRVAVVGAGPAGLAAAYHLLKLGLRPTLFDKNPSAGGTCLTAIPSYRLPREVLGAEVEHLLSLPIDYRPRTILGRDVSIEELRADFAATILAPGQQQPRPWSVDGVTPKDLHQGLDLLESWNSLQTAPAPFSAAVVGAGNTAIDVARVLKRAGVTEVHVISHKAKPGPGVPEDDVMPALAREIAEALEEGIHIHEHRGVRRLILRGERVVGVEMVHMKKLRRANGRLSRVAFDGTETVLHCDQVIPAVGQVLDTRGFESLLDAHGWFDLDDVMRVAGQRDVFVAGDAGGNAGTVTAAVGQGRVTAGAVAQLVRGHEPTIEAPRLAVPFSALNVHYHESAPRAEERVLPVAERGESNEVDLGLDRLDVEAEARRCLSCGNCMACDNCWTLCPDSAVLKTREIASDGSHYVFDYDYCKGCGLCAAECPCGYIEMIEDL